MAVNKANIVGFHNAAVWLVDSGGYAKGTYTAADQLAAGTTSHALRIANPRAFNFSPPQRTVASFLGGDRYLGQYMFGLTDFGSFTLEVSDTDLALFALATGNAVNTTQNTRWNMAVPGYDTSDLPILGMMFTAIAQSRESGTDGNTFYANYIFPRVQLSPSFNSLTTQAESNAQYQVSATMTDRLPTGETFTSVFGVEKDVGYAINSQYPLELTAYTHDGSATTFTLGYQPVDTTVTVNATGTYYAEAGVAKALSSVVASSGVCTVSLAASSGTRSVTLYETQHAATV